MSVKIRPDPCVNSVRLQPPSAEDFDDSLTMPFVGDWQVPDSEVLSSFITPSAATKRDRLAKLHPLPRDSRIRFFAEEHVYKIDEEEAPRSVTSLLHSFEIPFDGLEVAGRMQRSPNWTQRQKEFTKQDGFIMTPEEMAEAWNMNGRIQAARGTLMHYQIEQWLNGFEVPLPHSIEFKCFLRFAEDFLQARGLLPFRTEMSMFHCGLCCAGQADFLAFDPSTDTFVLLDWKRSKRIDYQNAYGERLLAPLEELDRCNYSMYSLQLNMYRYILESEYEISVSGMYLAVFHPNRDGPVWEEVPRLDDYIAKIVEWECKEGRAIAAQRGANAAFSEPPAPAVAE